MTSSQARVTFSCLCFSLYAHDLVSSICYNKSVSFDLFFKRLYNDWSHFTYTKKTNYYKRDPLEMTICQLESSHAEEICSWIYEAPYDIYNWPSWEQMKKDGIEFGDPVLRAAQYAAVLDNEQ